MTELTKAIPAYMVGTGEEWVNTTVAEMKSWRAKGGKWDQIAQDIKAVEDGDRIGSTFMDCVRLSNQIKAKDRVDVTAWGEDERNQAIKIHQREADNAKFRKLFDEALRLGAVIVWKPSIPLMVEYPRPLLALFSRMQDAWGELPPYIELVYEPFPDVYSIKPVWELLDELV